MEKFPKKKFDAIVVKIENVAHGVKKIAFKISEPFAFLSWQYVWVEIPEMKIADPQGSRRAFSIFNTINDENIIEIVARISDSGYKQNLFSLSEGDKLIIHGPFGNSFIVDDKHQPKNIIMIAGGVGIAAFMPMIETIRDKSYKTRSYLVYLNKDEASTPFLQELEEIKNNFKLFDYFNKYEYFSWNDVKDVAANMKGKIEWWIAGPQAMVDHVFKELEKGGISRLNMFFENFYPTKEYALTRKIIENQLNSDNLFFKAIENSTNHTVITDPEGTVIFANKAAEKITGYSQLEMLGNTPRLWGGMMSHEFYVDFWAKKESGEPYSGEIINRKKNGDIYHTIAHIAPIINEKKEIIGYIGTEEDISDRVLLEEKIIESKDFLDTIVKNLPSMVFVKDATNLNFTLFNRAGEELVGVPADKMIGKNDYDFFPKDQADAFTKKDREVLHNKKLVDIKEEPINTKKLGQRILHTKKIPILDSNGNAKFLLGISEDITEIKHWENALMAEKAKSEAVIDGMIDGIAIADKEGKLVYFNEVGSKILGMNASQSKAESWSKEYGLYDPVTMKICPPDELPLAQALKGKVVKDVVLFVRNANTPEGLYINVAATPITINNQSEGAVAIFRDITKERAVDKAKTEFVSLASHQLRTPLSAINWYAEMLLAGDAGGLSTEQEKYIKEIYAGNQRMVSLVGDLLNVSRLDLGTFIIEPKPIDVLALLKSVLSELQPQVKTKELTLKESFDKSIPAKFSADEKLLRMVFQNLISNSVKYTLPKGTVQVGVTVLSKDQVFGEKKLLTDSLAISVQDTGMGIPKAQQTTIFTKLFRADNAVETETEGTGLGLYIVKSIIDQSGGQVWFKSELNKGTEFYVTFPLSGMQSKEGSKKLQ